MTSDEASSVATPIEKVERTVDVRGIATHMFEAGPPTAASLLYLHDHGLGNLWLLDHQILGQSIISFPPDIPLFRLTGPPVSVRLMRNYFLTLLALLYQLLLHKARAHGQP